jgi:hypothetical protein
MKIDYKLFHLRDHVSFSICNFKFAIEEKALDPVFPMTNLKLLIENGKYVFLDHLID